MDDHPRLLPVAEATLVALYYLKGSAAAPAVASAATELFPPLHLKSPFYDEWELQHFFNSKIRRMLPYLETCFKYCKEEWVSSESRRMQKILPKWNITKAGIRYIQEVIPTMAGVLHPDPQYRKLSVFVRKLESK